MTIQLSTPVRDAMSDQIETTVGIHLNTVREALALHQRRSTEALA